MDYLVVLTVTVSNDLRFLTTGKWQIVDFAVKYMTDSAFLMNIQSFSFKTAFHGYLCIKIDTNCIKYSSNHSVDVK